IFNTVANAALPYFAPDVFGNPESMYNLAHEHIAIHSFRAAAMLFAYSSIYRVTLSYVQDQHLLQRFYRSFIYGHMKTLAAKEERRPGRVELDVVLNAIYRQKKERSMVILTSLLLRPYTHCFCQATPQSPTGTSSFQPLSRTAHHRSIDYFSPKFFNDLSVWDRASYMDNGIALPLEEHCQTWEAIQQWRSLSTADFMARYGNAKLALYNIPTEDELAMLASMDEDD
ncbi:hypothetical protein B0H13DRAFT_1667623, partial [Mycena leptocephala]